MANLGIPILANGAGLIYGGTEPTRNGNRTKRKEPEPERTEPKRTGRQRNRQELKPERT